MNSLFSRSIIMLAIAFVFAAPSAAQFVGTFTTMTKGMKDPTTPFTMKQEVSIKGGKIRTKLTSADTGPGSMTILYREDKGMVYTIFEAQKMYIELSIQKMREMMKVTPTPSKTASVQRTGKTMKILGHTCEQILLSEGEASIEAWATRDLPGLRQSMEKLNSYQKDKVAQWSKELEKMKLFPMKTVITVQGTKAETTITSIDQKTLPDSFFELPAGYTKQEIPAGMPGGGK